MLAWLDRHSFLALGLASVLLVTGVIGVDFGDDGPRQLVFRDGSQLAPGSAIRVHLSGAVVAPGVYQLREGDRLVDALAAAGGPANGADMDKLNLARRVRDEEQVVVPKVGAAPATPGEQASAAALPPGAKLDINTATEAQLDQLPGIGAAYSRRIVDSRKVDGPFRSIEELIDRRVLPRATFEKVSDLIAVSAP
jgi:competence protein ComEA